MIYNIKVYIEVYHLWTGSGKNKVNSENCSSISEIANKKLYS